MPGKLRSINIRVATNGWTADCDHEPDKSNKKNGGLCCYEPSTPAVFTDIDKLLSYVARELGSKKGVAEETRDFKIGKRKVA